MKITIQKWKGLADWAWKFRENSRILGKTKVGAAVLSKDEIFGGCNIEHKFRSHGKITFFEIHFKEISYSDVLSKNLRVMDLTAITLCKENSLPIRVFNINQSGDLKKVVEGDKICTLIRG